MGNCYSDNSKRLTDDERRVLQGTFFIPNGYDVDNSYVCAGYLNRYCDELRVKVESPTGVESLVPSIKQIYPVILSVRLNSNGIILWIGYD